MPTKEQARQIVSAVGKQSIKYSALMVACPFITEEMLNGIIQDDYVGYSPNVSRWNSLSKDTSLLRFVSVPQNYLPHYRFDDNDCFELAPKGLNLLCDVEKDMERERISLESLEEAKKSNILSSDANDIARRALQEARESKFIACIALVVAIIIGILTISG